MKMKKMIVLLIVVIICTVACSKKKEEEKPEPEKEATGVLINASDHKKTNKLAIHYDYENNNKLILIEFKGVDISTLSERISTVLGEILFENNEVSISLNVIGESGTAIALRNGSEWVYFDIWAKAPTPEEGSSVKKITQTEHVSLWSREDDAGKTTAISYFMCYQNGGKIVTTDKLGDYLPDAGYTGVCLGLSYSSELSEDEVLEIFEFLTDKINTFRYVVANDYDFHEVIDEATNIVLNIQDYYFLNDIITTTISKEIGIDFVSRQYRGAHYETGYVYDAGMILYNISFEKATNCNFSNYNKELKEAYNVYIPDKLSTTDTGEVALYMCRETSNSSTAKYNQTTLFITGEESISYEEAIEQFKKDFNLK